MRLAENVEEIGEGGGGQEADDNGPANELLAAPAVGPAHAGQ